MAMHVVVTGAGGFVGGFVARALAARGDRVTAITRRPPEPDDGSLAWHRANLTEPDALPDRFDALIHCAAELPAFCPEAERLYRLNLTAARSVFDQAVAARARSVVFLSSMSAYGTITVPLVHEDTPPQDPDAYGKAKLDAEGLLAGAVARGLRSGLAIRLPGTVGRGSHHNFLSDALARILAGQPVRANNPDADFNNIVYVGDLAGFLADWIVTPRTGFQLTNLAASEPLPIRDVLALLRAHAGRAGELIFSEGGKRPFLISLDRARSLGYSPATVRASLAAFVHASVA
jgi:nucleoside-diphosphate-sugar epimerase